LNHAEYAGSGIYSDSSLSHFINNIIWDNWLDELYIENVPPIFDYCDIQDTLVPGVGNIDVDPLFRDTANGDFHLMATYCGDPYDSPCIDAGDPASPLDPDSTIADMGALYFDQTTGIKFPPLLPREITLHQNYPNPFNASTIFQFTLPESQNVTLTVYDILGRRVKTLVDEHLQGGSHTIIFDASYLPSGIYFARLETDNATKSARMLLLR